MGADEPEEILLRGARSLKEAFPVVLASCGYDGASEGDLEESSWPGRERVKGAPEARAAGIETLDARVLATILARRVGGQAKGLPPTSRGKGWPPR